VSEKPRERSIAVLVIAALVAVTTLSLGTLGVHNHRAQRERAFASLANELTFTTNQLALGLALPLWNFDRPQVGKLLDGVMENRDIQAIVVRQADASAPGAVTTGTVASTHIVPLTGVSEPSPMSCPRISPEGKLVEWTFMYIWSVRK